MYNSQEIAEKIKEAVNDNGTKLGDMFSELGISPNTLHNMKTSMPKTDTLAKIADYLNVSVDYLLGRDLNTAYFFNKRLEKEKNVPGKAEDVMNAVIENSVTESKFRDMLNDMSTEDVAEILNYARYLRWRKNQAP
jgi:transcriptional regulator with XRE-family HTH domain